MPRVDPELCCHRLAIQEGAKPIAQKKRRMGQERTTATEVQVNKLLDVGSIREIQYSHWLSNVVIVKKSNGKWRTCTDYTDLNKACPKDPFPLLCNDKLLDSSAGYRYLSFLDAYNQIPMNLDDEDKTSFITDLGVFCYNVMPFGLKNAAATYQRMMDKVFDWMRGKEVEVYIDDMIVKTKEGEDLTEDLEIVLQRLRWYNLRLNPLKCTFGMEVGKFLGLCSQVAE
jgi:hypothetical protein